MTTKIIRVTGCHECLNNELWIEQLEVRSSCKLLCSGNMKYVADETIHPSCPLDSIDSLLAPIKKVYNEYWQDSFGENDEVWQAIQETLKLAGRKEE